MKRRLASAVARHTAFKGLSAGVFALGLVCGCRQEAPEPAAQAPREFDLRCPNQPLSPTPLRRLTRFEFENSVRDVFGADLPLQELFPADEVGLGFDNQGGTLTLGDLHVDGYLKAAEIVGRLVAEDAELVANLAGCSQQSRQCAEALVVSLGLRLERSPLSDGAVARLLAIFDEADALGSFQDGIARVVEALLQAPRFLYRLERESATPASLEGELASPWVLATRLAFLVWGAGPDDALLVAAGDGRLATAADVEREARRLLASARARRGVLHFYLQWLELMRFDELEKDRTLFNRWSDALRLDLQRETRRYVESVLWDDDARLSTLLSAPYSFANALLSDFYGLPISDIDATELVRVDFGAKLPRRGLLTQGSLLSLNAKANQTDPIHRGKFIRERFFCTPPPPPPPNLVVSPPQLDPGRTTRERFEQHRQDPVCSSCHELLDPVGLAFEHYDAVGRYRNTENGLPIDASGYLVGTDVDGPLEGVNDLSDKLGRSAQVNACVVKQWFRFAVGRGETDTDTCTLQKLESAFEQSGGDLGELMVAITQTDPFLRASPAPDPAEDAW